METAYKLKGYSKDPVYDALLWKLSQLAGEWRSTKNGALVQRYQHVLLSLLELGWQDELDVELELPDEYMPPEYLARYTNWEVSHAMGIGTRE